MTWHARMIAADSDFDGAPRLRREFVLEEGHGAVRSATLRLSALGVVEARINGRPIATCDVTPTCDALQSEADCLGRGAECSAVYTGINCTNSQGASCTAGSTNCTCESFRFSSCAVRTSSLMSYQLDDGTLVDVFSIR